MLISKANIPVRAYENTPSGIDCFVTTRHGGYSKGDFSSMNMAIYTDESASEAIKNTELLKSVFCLNNLTTLFQVHGNVVHEVTSDNYTDVMYREGDGLFTLEKDVALGVLTADCYNLFLAGKRGIAALHCGHKSVSSDIMTEAVKLFEKYDDYPVYAGIGPGISAENYEVGQELAEKFTAICSKAVTNNNGSYKLSIRTVIEENLKAKGITNIEHITDCTYASDDMYSYRRDNGKTGRMLGVIVRRESV